MKTFLGTLLTAAMLIVPASLTAQEDEVWSQQVSENDEQAVGYVITVEDDTFDLRTHADGVMTFPIPQNRDYSDDLQIGNRVQVFYNPELFDTGSLESVTFLETYSGPVEMEQNAELEPMDTEIENETEEALNEAENEAEQAWDETREETRQAMNEVEQETREAANEVEQEVDEAFTTEAEAEGTYASDEYDETYDSDELPQTASNMPMLLLGGLLLTLLGGVALRTLR